MSEHPTSSLDDVVHQRVRLGILAVTREARRVEFTFLRDTLGLTAGNLSQHLAVLEKAALVTVEKGYEGRRARTWIHLTRAGKHALDDEVTALKALIRQLEGPTAAAGPEGEAGPGPATPAPRQSAGLPASP
ncbi:transcriptional regulator [Kitasatospora sp. RG8]|uniref:winged helix-turn-helix domain-containing protein n=1 Tax=Kitasatospora sp. RG8 TaxID=2820815 RepID=UPI001AE037CC|nr:transcriptional regulator [Kitasatospora sp. RG8]MBP0451178.1 transcriptional regulator [Kitasatospora sp. RG8]